MIVFVFVAVEGSCIFCPVWHEYKCNYTTLRLHSTIIAGVNGLTESESNDVGFKCTHLQSIKYWGPHSSHPGAGIACQERKGGGKRGGEREREQKSGQKSREFCTSGANFSRR